LKPQLPDWKGAGLSPRFIKSAVVIAGICVLGGIGGYVLLSMLPAKPDWLYGRWWYDAPETEVQDSLRFKPKGVMEFLDADGKLVRQCRYTTLVENQINIRCKAKPQDENIVLKFRENNGARDLVNKAGKIYFKSDDR